MSDTGTGSTIVFGTVAIALEYTSVEVSGLVRESIDITHLGTTGYKDFIPGKLIDGGELSLEGLLDPDLGDSMLLKLGAVPELITITFPIPAGQSIGAKLAVQGFMSELEFSAAMEEEMPFSATIKVLGTPAPVFTDSVT